MEKRILMTGNEAIARGAYEAGVKVGTGYPGTPSTEILENLRTYPGITAEWSVNEKVALEAGFGAAITGARTLVTMKHVGLNVAADPLFTIAYTGIRAGLVIVTADDPGMHSSQNEQDNRWYALSAKVPCLEPSDSQEARDFTMLGYEISEKFDTPLLLRTTTRISHTKSPVTVREKEGEEKTPVFVSDRKKYVMIPAHARLRHEGLEKRLKLLAEYSGQSSLNRTEIKDKKTAFITSGISYQYVREIFPDASVLKIGMSHPLPEKLIADFCRRFKTVYVMEELDGFLELQIRALGIAHIKGKSIFPPLGELTPDSIRKAFGIKSRSNPPVPSLGARPPSLCPGCTHRGIFLILKKLKLKVSGDIGCYTLGVLPPYGAMDTTIDMGAGVTVAQGIEIAQGENPENRAVSVIGDSTFAHSGITGLLNAAYNKRKSLVIILDNGTTAMTGMQENPASGKTLCGEETARLDYSKLCESFGIPRDNFRTVDAFAMKEMEQTIRRFLDKKELSVIVVKGLCRILHNRQKRAPLKRVTVVDREKCKLCNICLTSGCSAITRTDDAIVIDKNLCSNCTICIQMCPHGAIHEKDL